MNEIDISRQEFRRSLRPVEDMSWVKMEIENIQGNGTDWIAILKDKDDRYVKMGVTASQITHMVPGMRGLSGRMLFATPYQLIDRLAQAFGARSVCAILDCNLDKIVAGRVELKKADGEVFFLRMAGGDALAYAVLMGIPIYMVEDLVNFLTERN